MKTSEEVFAALKEFFANRGIDQREQSKVWRVLSALRGPDFPDSYHEKWATTAIIRHKLLGYGSTVESFADMNGDAANGPFIRKGLE